jgi:chromosome segregation ATPase
MGNKYIYNRHIAPITANARDSRGRVLFTKTFQPERINGTTGRVISTGYTTLTGEEYRQLDESSRTFAVYRDKHKFLVEYDELPPEAKTPQEALVDARTRITALNGEAAGLKAELQKAAKENEGLKAELQKAAKENEGLKAGLQKVAKENEELKAELQKAAAERAGKNGKGKEN